MSGLSLMSAIAPFGSSASSDAQHPFLRTPPREGASSSIDSPLRVTSVSGGGVASPQHVKSPMKYHHYEGVVEEKQKQLKKLAKREKQTLAPGSAEKQFRVLQRNYSTLRASQKRLDYSDAEASEVMLVEGSARVVVRPKEFQIESHGKRRVFGVHQVELKDGSGQKRAYPLDGDGVLSLPGSQLAEFVGEYKKTRREMSFEEFVKTQLRATARLSAEGGDGGSAPSDTSGGTLTAEGEIVYDFGVPPASDASDPSDSPALPDTPSRPGSTAVARQD